MELPWRISDPQGAPLFIMSASHHIDARGEERSLSLEGRLINGTGGASVGLREENEE